MRLPHTGEAIPMDMTRALLQCYPGTYCSFPNLLYCLKRFLNEHDSEDRLASIIADHLLPSQSRPELSSSTDPPLRHKLDTSMTGPNCSPWKETRRQWLMDNEAFEAVPQIKFHWEDPEFLQPRQVLDSPPRLLSRSPGQCQQLDPQNGTKRYEYADNPWGRFMWV